MVKGKKILVIEDGPTLTHGSMTYGAGVIAARNGGAAEIVDPAPYAVASIAATYKKYPNAKGILPAMGYGDKQIILKYRNALTMDDNDYLASIPGMMDSIREGINAPLSECVPLEEVWPDV